MPRTKPQMAMVDHSPVYTPSAASEKARCGEAKVSDDAFGTRWQGVAAALAGCYTARRGGGGGGCSSSCRCAAPAAALLLLLLLLRWDGILRSVRLLLCRVYRDSLLRLRLRLRLWLWLWLRLWLYSIYMAAAAHH